jgi:hypothetical protein
MYNSFCGYRRLFPGREADCSSASAVLRLCDVHRDGFTFVAKLDGIMNGLSSLKPF